MTQALPFELTDTPSSPSDAKVVDLPAGISGAQQLLAALYERLTLPGYFGFNWDALSDCLRDLGWVSEREVVLRHADVPQLSAAELRTYLEVLVEAVDSWQDDEPHSLRVQFPTSARAALESLLCEP